VARSHAPVAARNAVPTAAWPLDNRLGGYRIRRVRPLRAKWLVCTCRGSRIPPAFGGLKILGLKPSHDGAFALLHDNRLVWGLEAEKDSFPRFNHLTAEHFISVFELLDDIPDVLAVSGWTDVGAGYYGVNLSHTSTRMTRHFGKPIRIFSSSHERSHIWCAYGLSPLPRNQECYCLVWEGLIGRFYYIGSNGNIDAFPTILPAPGYRYAFAYALADPCYPRWYSGALDLGGKMMALAAMTAEPPTIQEMETVENLLHLEVVDPTNADFNLPLDKTLFASWLIHNSGLLSATFLRCARHLHNRIFEEFCAFARKHLTRRLPLVIGGGCGLNCDWNTRWRESGLFEEVFVPPCPNDCGSAIGTAADALQHYTGAANLTWHVDCGLTFALDSPLPSDFAWEDYSADLVAQNLAACETIPWIQGRYELGPRALGFRSLLAEPFSPATRDRLNHIKAREAYRPIAPVCLEEDASALFRITQPSPYMLYTSQVNSRRLTAVTHSDGSARLQTVSPAQNARLHTLLRCFKRLTGVGALCNSSLNFPRKGFINSLSDLLVFMRTHHLKWAVVDDRVLSQRRTG
jgi:predicted NodU family carbamoyl transferase